MSAILNAFVNSLFPHICCLCGHHSHSKRDLCATCITCLPGLLDRCYRCGLRLTGLDDPICCKACLNSPPPFDRLLALFSYDPPATRLITGLKFGRQLSKGSVLGELLADAVCQEWYKDGVFPEAIIPVPLHAKRLRQRGFNQALELLWPLKRRLKLPILLDVCQRVRATKPQSGLSAAKRKQNLQQAFKIMKPIPFQHVAIMDDVVTTGTTVSALSRSLKEAGVLQIDVFCICRA